MAEIRFHLDEHIEPGVANALRSRGVDVTTAADAGLLQAADIEHLAFALREGRVFVTYDSDFLSIASLGMHHCGIVYARQSRRTMREIINGLLLIHGVLEAEEMMDRVEFA